MIEIDRRVIPGENPAEVIPHVERYLRGRIDDDSKCCPPGSRVRRCPTATNGAWADRLMKHIEQVAASACENRRPLWDERVATGTGPESGRRSLAPDRSTSAHTKDEFLELSQLEQAVEILYRFCAAP